MSPIIEDSDSKEDDGLNLDAARFITWSISESTPANRLLDEINPWLDSETNEECVSRCPSYPSVSTHIG